MKVFIDLKWFFKQEKRPYILGISLLIVVAMLELVAPKVIGIVVDEIKNGTLSPSMLFKWMLVLALTVLTMYVARYYWRLMIFGSAYKLARQLRDMLYSHFTKMSQTFYQKKRVGDLMAHATNDLQAIQQTAGAGVLTMVDSLTIGIAVIVVMAATISWKLTIICLIPMPLMAIMTNWYGGMLHKRFYKAQEAFSSLNDKTQESITGIKVIKTFGQEKEDIDEFYQQSADVVKKNLAVARVDALYDPTVAVIVGVSFFLSIAFGAKFVLDGAITIGELISFNAYLGLLVWPMLAFGWLFNIVERGRASYDRVRSILDEPVDVEDGPGAIDEVPSGEIAFHIEKFSYPGGYRPVLNQIEFRLKRGETLGIVGKTGAGKTTLLKLLIREIEGFDGEISFGGRQLHEYKLERLREAIGYVPQEHFLFSSSVADNISFAKPEASMEEIQYAARLAKMDQDILQFTDGYDTIVGERGVSLSGGQKQRISIARALLMEPEVLILDDSLSAVDAKTEEGILSALRETRAGKTTIITAHRLSAIQHADLILVLDEGEIAQMGTHYELMNEDGWYKEMYLHQQLEELVEKGGAYGQNN
ncbi:ABC transporter transmembrane domain-containing protein [Bacillus benzoevorans]|uniref:ATP-binding cassette subfamily B protein n=1 Tax=Bacillus benzoevorans TaxID=1456 RepID=A0A7X0LVC8_9BACI|nr:ABC transporter transmembrane domain-containing protein [Bacillus benzoevorans]MBB6444164.1 ATP-binding cassette subfamily B protein [Bacillus benzoevorans]